MKSERSYPIYKVNKKAEASLVGGHPWVYENDILEFPETEPENGTLADVVSPKGAYLGTGFVSLKSKIRVRLISRNANDTFDASFWRRRVEYAWAYRKTVLEPADLSACRVIFGEADQFPGLTVDRFNNILVTQTLSVGMEKLKPVLFPLLAEVLRADGQTIDGIYERNDEALRAKEGLEQSRAGSSCRVKATPPPPRPRSARTASTTTSISRTARRPASSSTRSTTAGQSPASPPATPCWTASPTPAALPSTQPAAAQPGSRQRTSAPTPSPWLSGTRSATA